MQLVILAIVAQCLSYSHSGDDALWSLRNTQTQTLWGANPGPWQSMNYCYRNIHVTTWVLLSTVKSRCHCYRQQKKYPLYRQTMHATSRHNVENNKVSSAYYINGGCLLTWQCCNWRCSVFEEWKVDSSKQDLTITQCNTALVTSHNVTHKSHNVTLH